MQVKLPEGLKYVCTGRIGNTLVCVAEGTTAPRKCPSCAADNFYRHGLKVQDIRDVPQDGYQVVIRLRRRRYRCKNCGRTVLEPIASLHERRNMTKRLTRYIVEHSLNETFSSLSETIGIDSRTIKAVFDEMTQHYVPQRQIQRADCLGIVMAKITSRMRPVIVTCDPLSIVDILPETEAEEVKGMLRELRRKTGARLLHCPYPLNALPAQLKAIFPRLGKELPLSVRFGEQCNMSDEMLALAHQLENKANALERGNSFDVVKYRLLSEENSKGEQECKK